MSESEPQRKQRARGLRTTSLPPVTGPSPEVRRRRRRVGGLGLFAIAVLIGVGPSVVKAIGDTQVFKQAGAQAHKMEQASGEAPLDVTTQAALDGVIVLARGTRYQLVDSPFATHPYSPLTPSQTPGENPDGKLTASAEVQDPLIIGSGKNERYGFFAGGYLATVAASQVARIDTRYSGELKAFQVRASRYKTGPTQWDAPMVVGRVGFQGSLPQVEARAAAQFPHTRKAA
ncbi:MAG TPA: hypothetical protein VGS28_04575 [Candidatus Saccharimonadales bacterium]|nr:hypothetical protein [Candidatus Saccharimonadales bacterium]